MGTDAKTSESLAAIYTAWLAKKELTAETAAPVVGLSVSTSYEYASGLSVPPNSRVRHFAAKIDQDPEILAAVARRDRPVCRRRKTLKKRHGSHSRKSGAA